jgi:chromosome condensin MukBEF ATPase and DNA-binding subunit MukB
MSNEFGLLMGMIVAIVLVIFVSLNAIKSGIQNTLKETELLDKLESLNKSNSVKNSNQVQFDLAHNLLMNIGDTLSNKEGIEQYDDMKVHYKSVKTYYKNSNEQPVNISQYKKELEDSAPIERPVFKVVE